MTVPDRTISALVWVGGIGILGALAYYAYKGSAAEKAAKAVGNAVEVTAEEFAKFSPAVKYTFGQGDVPLSEASAAARSVFDLTPAFDYLSNRGIYDFRNEKFFPSWREQTSGGATGSW